MTATSRSVRRVFLLVPIILALAACSDDEHASGALPVTLGSAGPGDAGERFPMQVGNVWQFTGTTIGTGAPLRTYVNVVTTVGTREVDGGVATVFRDSNPSGSGIPEESFLVPDANGIAYFGSDQVDILSAQLVPYWELRFPFEVGNSFVQVDRTGAKFGDDLDGDLVDEVADLRSVVTVRGLETVSVAAGSFSGCARVEWRMTMDVLLSSDRSRVRATAIATAWLAPGIGWVKRERTVSIEEAGYSETETEELVAFSVNGRAEQITLRVTPEAATVMPAGMVRLHAQAYTPAGAPVSVPVVWSSSDPGIAQVTPDGAVLGITSGSATVIATAGEIASNPSAITVSGTGGGGGYGGGSIASITVTPSAVTVAKNGTAGLLASAFDAQGFPSYASSFSWSSSDPAVATVDSSGLVRGVSPGTANVTASSSGVTSSAVSVTVSAVEIVTLATNDLVYDPSRQLIYASLPSRQGTNGNSVASIDPESRTVLSTVYVGSEPTKLALSDDARFLYVALDGAGQVARLDLAHVDGPRRDLTFSLGDGSFGARYVEDIEVMPGAPRTVAISLRYKSVSPRHAGVAVFDDGVQRPNATPGHTGSNVIEFSSVGTLLYGLNTETTEFGFRRMQVDAQGVSVLTVDDVFSGFGVDIAFDRGLVFSTSGQVLDPEARELSGTFTGLTWGSLVEPDPASTRVLFLTQADVYSGPWALKAFDRTRFLPVASEIVPSVSGTPGSLLRWGASGIAFRASNDAVFFLETPVAGP